MKRCHLWYGLALATTLAAGSARAVSLPADLNLVDLIDLSDSIVVGTVTSVTDGIDGTYGLPYTEVTLSVEETLKGTQSPGAPYTFHQLGLLTPRLSADGTKIMPEAPPGIPRYDAGDRVMLFLGPPASVTGLQSTVALGIGRFELNVGNAINDLDNTGVFQNISLANGLATYNDERILATTAGAVNQADFLSFVRRAVEANWIDTCRMWKTDQGMPNCGLQPRPRQIKPKGSLSTSPTVGVK